MKKYLAKSKLKSVYVENGKATKVFAKTYNKSDVLYEALNTSRVEDAGVNIPKLLEVAVTDGKWSITSEYVEGPTLTQLYLACNCCKSSTSHSHVKDKDKQWVKNSIYYGTSKHRYHGISWASICENKLAHTSVCN